MLLLLFNVLTFLMFRDNRISKIFFESFFCTKTQQNKYPSYGTPKIKQYFNFILLFRKSVKVIIIKKKKINSKMNVKKHQTYNFLCEFIVKVHP